MLRIVVNSATFIASKKTLLSVPCRACRPVQPQHGLWNRKAISSFFMTKSIVIRCFHIYY